MKVKLREIRTQPTIQRGQQGILLSDPLGVGQKTLFIPSSLALLLTLMDGTRDIGTLRAGFELRTGTPLSSSFLDQFVSELDDALFLENEHFSRAHEAALEDYLNAASRPPVLAGKCYPVNAGELATFLQQYFNEAGDESPEYDNEVRGVVSPHIDFERGGHIYAKVWSKAKAALRQAELVVLLGTDHNDGKGSVTLTRQQYETPWGTIPTAQDVVDELLAEIGPGIFDRELHHRGEHSIESAIVWLHYLLGNKPCQALPVLCGSFQPFIEAGESPREATHISLTIEVLKRLATCRRTIVVAAADLAHMGPVFGDAYPLDLVGRATIAKQDQELINIMSHGQADDFLAHICKEKDRRHVCGVPPIYMLLSLLPGVQGKLLGYEQCPASPDGTSLVSICGMLY
jgi:hypothetical protein